MIKTGQNGSNQTPKSLQPVKGKGPWQLATPTAGQLLLALLSTAVIGKLKCRISRKMLYFEENAVFRGKCRISRKMPYFEENAVF
jgi:hypothetical protein